VSAYARRVVASGRYRSPGRLDLHREATQILETVDRVTRRNTIRMCKVRWGHYSEEEATWEREDDLMAKYPELFACQP
jgi:hypothetical protein